MLLPCNTLLRQ